MGGRTSTAGFEWRLRSAYAHGRSLAIESRLATQAADRVFAERPAPHTYSADFSFC